MFFTFFTFDLHLDSDRALKLKKYLFYAFFVNFHRSLRMIASFVGLKEAIKLYIENFCLKQIGKAL